MLRVTLVLLAPLSLLLAQAPQPAAAEAMLVVEGQVVDLRGEPVLMAKVRVLALDEPDRVLAETTCDAAGCFRCGRVPGQGPWIVRARSPGHCDGEVQTRSRSVRIEVHEAVTLRGVMLGETGTPVAGAAVWAHVIARILRDVKVETTTDASGRFTLTGIPLGLVQLSAVGCGGELAELQTLVGADDEVKLRAGPARTTSLKIHVSGLPADRAASVRLSIRPSSVFFVPMPSRWREPLLDRDGRLEWHGVPDLPYEVIPSSADFAFAPDQTQVRAPGPHVLEFTATRMGSAELRCRARVHDEQGKPVAGLRLEMASARTSNRTEAVSGADGTLTFASPEVAGGRVKVCSLDDSFVPKLANQDIPRLGSYYYSNADPGGVLDLCVVPACSVKGRVLLPDGRPATFAEVHFEGAKAPGLQLVTTTTDRDGNYRFAQRRHDDHSLRVSVRRWDGTGDSEPFALTAAGTHLTLPVLKLVPGATIEGTVVDTDQRPAPGIRVWLRDCQPHSYHLVEVITDRRGRYRFVGVPPGEACLQVLVLAASPQGRAAQLAVEAGKTYACDLKLEGAR